ncbi:MAG: YgiT-type zinc finger protein [Chitinispirillaceae bacterium]|nr:YgiT-type zinc finger protein [Chitinispirillaceae bacterium]
MKCVICHGAEIERKKVNEEVQIGHDVVFISVDVLACKNCGERYYDRKTKRYLEEITEEVKKGSVPLRDVGKVSVLAA